MRVQLPWPTTANRRLSVYRGRMLATSQYREWKERAAEYLLAQLIGTPKLRGRCQVLIEAWPPDHRRRDIDNVVKPALDALVRARLIGDDFDVERITVQRCVVWPTGRLILHVEEIAPGQ